VGQRHPAGEDRGQPLVDIAGLSRELVDSMSDIVWAIDPEQDRLDDLTHRMRRFAGDLFSYNGVRVRFQAPGGEKIRASTPTSAARFSLFSRRACTTRRAIPGAARWISGSNWMAAG
jgi:hypothetical protein